MKHIKRTWATVTALALGLFLPISAIVGAPLKSDASSGSAAGAVSADSHARNHVREIKGKNQQSISILGAMQSKKNAPTQHLSGMADVHA